MIIKIIIEIIMLPNENSWKWINKVYKKLVSYIKASLFNVIFNNY